MQRSGAPDGEACGVAASAPSPLVASESAVDDAATRAVAPCLPPLQRDTVLHIFGLLTCEERARASLVSRGWREALADSSLWATVDLRAVTVPRRLATVLTAIVARAPRCLRTLLLPDALEPESPYFWRRPRFEFVDVLNAVVANPHLLRLRCHVLHLGVNEVERILAAAPGLTSLEAALSLSELLSVVDTDTASHEHARALRLLQREPPFGCVKMLSLDADAGGYFGHWHRFGGLSAWLPLWTAHADLRELSIGYAELDTTAFGGVVQLAVDRQLHAVEFFACEFVGGNCIWPLVQLLTDDLELRKLSFYSEGSGIFESEMDEDDAGVVYEAFLNALIASFLRVLSLEQCGVEYFGPNIIEVLVGHEYLEELCLMADIRSNDDESDADDSSEEVSFATAIGHLIRVDSPALRKLKLTCWMRNAEALSLFEALPHNTHLLSLEIAESYMTAAFLREVVFPAVRANESLQMLHITCDDPDLDAIIEDIELAWPVMDELRNFVHDRAAAAAAVRAAERASGEQE